MSLPIYTRNSQGFLPMPRDGMKVKVKTKDGMVARGVYRKKTDQVEVLELLVNGKWITPDEYERRNSEPD